MMILKFNCELVVKGPDRREGGRGRRWEEGVLVGKGGGGGEGIDDLFKLSVGSKGDQRKGHEDASERHYSLI